MHSLLATLLNSRGAHREYRGKADAFSFAGRVDDLPARLAILINLQMPLQDDIKAIGMIALMIELLALC